MKTVKCLYAIPAVSLVSYDWEDREVDDKGNICLTPTGGIPSYAGIFNRFARMAGLKGPASGEFGVVVNIPADDTEPATYEYQDAYGNMDWNLAIEFPLDAQARSLIRQTIKAGFYLNPVLQNTTTTTTYHVWEGHHPDTVTRSTSGP